MSDGALTPFSTQKAVRGSGALEIEEEAVGDVEGDGGSA